MQQPLVDGIPVRYEVIDQTAYDLAVTAGPPIGLGETMIGMLVSAPTMEDLGTKIIAPKLAETVHRYNADIDAGDVLGLHAGGLAAGLEAWK